MCRRYRFCLSSVLAIVLTLQLAGASLAAAPFVNSPAPAALSAQNPSPLAAYGEPLSEDEMVATEGEWGQIVLGVLGAVVFDTARYAMEDEDPTWGEYQDCLTESVITGAVIGTVGVGIAIAQGASLALSAAKVTWTALGSLYSGTIMGTVDRIRGE